MQNQQSFYGTPELERANRQIFVGTIGFIGGLAVLVALLIGWGSNHNYQVQKALREHGQIAFAVPLGVEPLSGKSGGYRLSYKFNAAGLPQVGSEDLTVDQFFDIRTHPSYRVIYDRLSPGISRIDLADGSALGRASINPAYYCFGAALLILVATTLCIIVAPRSS